MFELSAIKGNRLKIFRYGQMLQDTITIVFFFRMAQTPMGLAEIVNSLNRLFVDTTVTTP